MFDNEFFITKNGNIFHLIGKEPYTRKNGTKTELKIWESKCKKCEDKFFVKTPFLHETSKAFGRIHCEKHKLTKEEIIKACSDSFKNK